MTDSVNEELIKAIKRYRIKNQRPDLELSRRWGKSVSQQVQMYQNILDSYMYSILPSAGSVAIAGTPPVTPVWISEDGADLESAAVTGEEQVRAVITGNPSKGVNMITVQELTDTRLFEASGYFSSDQISSIANRAKDQWTPSVDDFAHVCFTANGGTFAFVIVKKNERNVHSRIFGCPNDKMKKGDLFKKEHAVTIGRWSLTQSSFTSVGVNRLRLPYDYDGVFGPTTFTDVYNGMHADSHIADEVFNDCLACFKQAELDGMIQNLSISGTCSSYGGASTEPNKPIIKLMDLELF